MSELINCKNWLGFMLYKVH